MKAGRPRKPDAEKRRVNVTTRMREATKIKLATLAADNGHSMSREIEARLEASFLADRLENAIQQLERYGDADLPHWYREHESTSQYHPPG